MIASLRPVLIPSLPRLRLPAVRTVCWLLGWWLVGFCPTALLVWLTA